MAEHLYEIYTRQAVAPFARTGVSRRYTRFGYTRRYQAHGQFAIDVPEEAPEIASGNILPGNLIEITRDGVTDFFGYVTGARRTWDEKYPATAVASLKGWDLSGWILRQRCAVPPTALVQYYGNSGTAETVMKQALTDHFINPVDATRTVLSLQNEALHSPTLGGTVTVNLRGEKWVDALAQIALAGSVGFRTWIRDDLGLLEFQVYVGDSHTAGQTLLPAVILNPNYHDLLQFLYEIDLEALENHVYMVGGDGSAANRFISESENAASVTAWGRYEVFQDGRNAYTPAIAATEAQMYLAPHTPVTRVAFRPKDTAQIQYNRDWKLGDLVTVRYDRFGVDLALPIVETNIRYEQNVGERIEVSTSLLTPDVTRKLRQMVQQVTPALFAPTANVLPRYNGTAAVPTVPPPYTGFKFFDTSNNTEKTWDGTVWRTITWT